MPVSSEYVDETARFVGATTARIASATAKFHASLRQYFLGSRQHLLFVNRSHEFPKPIRVQPDGIGVPGDELLDRQAFNQWRPRNPLLFAVQEDRHELIFLFAPRSFLGGGTFAFHGRALMPFIFSAIPRDIAAEIGPPA